MALSILDPSITITQSPFRNTQTPYTITQTPFHTPPYNPHQPLTLFVERDDITTRSGNTIHMSFIHVSEDQKSGLNLTTAKKALTLWLLIEPVVSYIINPNIKTTAATQPPPIQKGRLENPQLYTGELQMRKQLGDRIVDNIDPVRRGILDNIWNSRSRTELTEQACNWFVRGGRVAYLTTEKTTIDYDEDSTMTFENSKPPTNGLAFTWHVRNDSGDDLHKKHVEYAAGLLLRQVVKCAQAPREEFISGLVILAEKMKQYGELYPIGEFLQALSIDEGYRENVTFWTNRVQRLLAEKAAKNRGFQATVQEIQDEEFAKTTKKRGKAVAWAADVDEAEERRKAARGKNDTRYSRGRNNPPY